MERISKVKKTKFTPVEKLDQWSSGLEAFRNRHHLSIRKLAGVCSQSGESISKSSMERLLNGKAEPRFIQRIRPAIRQSLRAYLAELKKTDAEIDMELRSIFCSQEIENMIAQPKELTTEAQQFFGLRRDPFDPLEPRTIGDVFTTPALDKTARQIEKAIREQRFVAVIGDIGSGKTILKKRIIHTVNQSSGRLRLFWPEFFNMDRVNSGSIVYWLLRQFGQERVPQDLLSRAGALKNILAKLSDDGVRVALGFDECHRLDERMIVALKNFWELGSGGFDRYLGVLLFGQPSFRFILANHREIAERCEVIEMPALKTAAKDYLDNRISLAGGKMDKLFEPAAIARITKLATTPLALGNVANAGLLKAFSMNERRVVAAFIPEINGDPQVKGIRSAQI